MEKKNNLSIKEIESHKPPINAFSPLFKFKNPPNPGSKMSIGVDIGGSLVKLGLVINKTETKLKEYFESKNIFEILEEKDHFLFLTLFPTEDFITKIIPMFQEVSTFAKIETVRSTGGGAYKFKELVKQKFDIDLEKYDELLSLVRGYIFLSSFNSFYKIDKDNQIVFVPPSDLVFPHIAVNIGSGVSILKVDSPDDKDIQRITGSIFGGGTLIGLSKILIGEDKYSKIIELAKQGDYRNTDYTMKDMNMKVGGKYTDDDFHVASSLAKVQEYINLGILDKCSKADIALSLLLMICSHIAQISSLTAMQYGIDQVLIFGNFSRRGSQAVFLLNQSFQFYGKNLKVRFNYYDGYPGATGVLIEKADK